MEKNNSQYPYCGRRSPALNQSTDYWPWHAAIYISGTRINETSPEYKCSATVIDGNTVITAAHCVCTNNQPLDAENVLVSLGKRNLTELHSSNFLKVRDIIQHPNYTHVGLSNDIAIIKLLAEATFDDYVQPICLWDSSKSELSELKGKMGTLVVWGETETGRLPDTIQHSNMSVVDHATCLETDRDFYGRFISTKSFCAGFPNGTHACLAKSGGALSFEQNGTNYIRGIVSAYKVAKTGEICDPNAYTQFTDVAKYSLWIAEVEKCEKKVSCDWQNTSYGVTCQIHINVTFAERSCKVIVENALINPHAARLVITGNVEVLPDFTDVFDKLKIITNLVVSNITEFKFIGRSKLFVARQISTLILNDNSIENISPETFDDLSDLESLDLRSNRLNVLHRDVFKGLHSLKQVWLQNNDLEMLPEGLFRNNNELRAVVLSSNKLKVIETDFTGLLKLDVLKLDGNECINEENKNRTSIITFQTKIISLCKS